MLPQFFFRKITDICVCSLNSVWRRSKVYFPIVGVEGTDLMLQNTVNKSFPSSEREMFSWNGNSLWTLAVIFSSTYLFFLLLFSTPFRLCMYVLNLNIIRETDINIYIRSFRQISNIAGYCKVCCRMWWTCFVQRISYIGSIGHSDPVLILC